MSTEERRRQHGERAIHATAILIGEAPAERLLRVLRSHGFQTSAFERVEDVPAGEQHDDPSVVALWIGDTSSSSSSPAPAVSSIARRFDGVPLVLVCDGIERWGVRAALSSGAAGVVLYEELDAVLGPCIQAVLAGQVCVPRTHRQQVEPPALSAREKQILALVVMGYMNSQIAEQLFLAESTVKSHLSSAFGKLGVRSRNEAVNLILRRDGGLGMGILGLGAEPLHSGPAAS